MRAFLAAALGFVALLGCARGEPPAPEGSQSIAFPDPAFLAPRTRPDRDLGPPNAEDGSSGVVAEQALSQTHDMPSAKSSTFEQGARALWQAIVADNPPAGLAFFFPLAAYEQVKDVANPAADWKNRLVAAYTRDIHALHASIGDALERAEFLSLDVPSNRARWVEPGEEWNKVGYFRVFGSKLRYRIGGEERSLDVKSLISWRGEWYVVHLSAIR